MRRPSRATLSRLAEVLVPWAVGVLLFLTAVDWADRESSAPAVLLAFALAIVQGAACGGGAGAPRPSRRSSSRPGSASSS